MGGAGGTAFLEPFLVDKWRVVLGDMRRANLLGDRRFLDLVAICYFSILNCFTSH